MALFTGVQKTRGWESRREVGRASLAYDATGDLTTHNAWTPSWSGPCSLLRLTAYLEPCENAGSNVANQGWLRACVSHKLPGAHKLPGGCRCSWFMDHT